MTATLEAPFVPINSAKQDFHTANGVRISLPAYVDLPVQTRKSLLNAVRTAMEREDIQSTPKTQSGISVTSVNSSHVSGIERYLGMSLAVLRSVLFARGGLALDLVLRLQNVGGIEVVSTAELIEAFDNRKEFVTTYTSTYPYTSN